MSRCEAAAVELLEDRRLLSATGAEESDAATEEAAEVSADESEANGGYEGDYGEGGAANLSGEEFYSEQCVGGESDGDTEGNGRHLPRHHERGDDGDYDRRRA